MTQETFKTKCKIHYNEELARKLISEPYAEFRKENAIVHWSLLLLNHGDHCRLSIHVDKVEAMLEWIVGSEADETGGWHIVRDGEILLSSEKDWKVINMNAPIIEDDEPIFKINFKPLIVEVDFRTKEFVVEEWGESLNKRIERILTTIDPAVRYQRNPDGSEC